MCRDIVVPIGSSAEQAVVKYLREGRTKSAREWAKRPVIALAPDDLFGRVIWEH